MIAVQDLPAENGTQPVLEEAPGPFHDWLTAQLESLPAWCGTGWFSALLILGLSAVAGWITQRVLLGTLLVWTRRTHTTLDENLIQRLRVPIVTSVVLYGMHAAATRFMIDGAQPFQLTLSKATTIGDLLATFALLVWTWAALSVASLLLSHASKSPERYRVVESRTFPLFENLSRVFVVGGAIYAFLIIWNINATGMLTSAGVAGVVIGFAAKDTLSNLFAGVFIVADAPYRIGDYIVLDTGVRGRVVNIGLRSTRIMTRDDVEITIPNAVIGSSRITNQSGGGTTRMRVRIKFSVAYDTDIERVREILKDLATAEGAVCASPEPRIRFRSFGDSGLQFELLVWVSDPALRGKMVDSLNTSILTAFRVAGIEIPYPKRDLYLHQR